MLLSCCGGRGWLHYCEWQSECILSNRYLQDSRSKRNHAGHIKWFVCMLRKTLFCWNSALLVQGMLSSTIRGCLNRSAAIKSRDLSTPPGLLVSAVRQPAIRLASWVPSAIGAEVILRGCGIWMVQDQQACAFSLTYFNPCFSVFPLPQGFATTFQLLAPCFGILSLRMPFLVCLLCTINCPTLQREESMLEW